jgi:hypothetical protein
VIKEDPREILDHLLTGIGARPPTSLQEAEAAAYIDGRLRLAGMHVSADTLDVSTTPGVVYPLVALLGILVALLALSFPLPSFLLSLWLLILVLRDTFVAPLPTFASRQNTQNIIATCASENAPPHWRLVFLAPLDTPPQTGLIHQHPSYRHIAAVLRIGAMALLCVLTLVGLLVPLSWGSYALILPVVLFVLMLIPFSPSSSVLRPATIPLAVLLDVAERFSQSSTVELWIVGLGATTTGTASLHDFLRRYPFPPASTLFVALGPMSSVHFASPSREGLVPPRHADSHLLSLATTIASADLRIPLVAGSTVMTSFAFPLLSQQYRTITLSSEHKSEKGGKQPEEHVAGIEQGNQPDQANQPGQADPDNQVAETIEMATRFLLRLVHHLDTGD